MRRRLRSADGAWPQDAAPPPWADRARPGEVTRLGRLCRVGFDSPAPPADGAAARHPADGHAALPAPHALYQFGLIERHLYQFGLVSRREACEHYSARSGIPYPLQGGPRGDFLVTTSPWIRRCPPRARTLDSGTDRACRGTVRAHCFMRPPARDPSERERRRRRAGQPSRRGRGMRSPTMPRNHRRAGLPLDQRPAGPGVARSGGAPKAAGIQVPPRPVFPRGVRVRVEQRAVPGRRLPART